jgi:hypothetical protein
MFKALKETLGYNCKMTLKYRASRDGWDGKDYHRISDNLGPTVSLIMTANNVLCGGFLKIPI